MEMIATDNSYSILVLSIRYETSILPLHTLNVMNMSRIQIEQSWIELKRNKGNWVEELHLSFMSIKQSQEKLQK